MIGSLSPFRFRIFSDLLKIFPQYRKKSQYGQLDRLPISLDGSKLIHVLFKNINDRSRSENSKKLKQTDCLLICIL